MYLLNLNDKDLPKDLKYQLGTGLIFSLLIIHFS
jgi:hypothetical protein